MYLIDNEIIKFEKIINNFADSYFQFKVIKSKFIRKYFKKIGETYYFLLRDQDIIIVKFLTITFTKDIKLIKFLLYYKFLYDFNLLSEKKLIYFSGELYKHFSINIPKLFTSGRLTPVK